MNILIWLLLPSFVSAAWFHSSEKRFKGEAMLDLGSLGLDDGFVAAFADVNSDQFTDIFLLSPDQRSLNVWLWDHKQYKFVLSQQQPIRLSDNRRITSVVPSDFNYDGRIDILLHGITSSSDNELSNDILIGNGDGKFNSAVVGPTTTRSHPLILDADGDMRADLLAVQSSYVTGSGGPMLWRNVFSDDDPSKTFQETHFPANGSSFDCGITNPHSNAWVDLDGDCLADLFLTCRDSSDSSQTIYQIWTNGKNEGFKLARSGRLPQGAGQVTFADIDRDGAIDMVFPVVTNGQSHITIAYNKQKPLCSSTAKDQETICRPSKDLCSADPNFSFDEDLTKSSENVFIMSLSDIIPNAPYFMFQSSSFDGDLPMSIKIGDYNHDGYPDLLFVSSSSYNPNQGIPILLENTPCDHTCTAEQMNANRRSFQQLTSGVQSLAKITDAMGVAWIDLDEDGSLDILVQRKGSGGLASRTPTFFKNNFYHDAFFLKALAANGACSSICSHKDEEAFKPFGVNYAGATYKFIVLDSSGQKKVTHASQLSQSAYNALLTPYAHLGLGRLNNYIESLYVGSTRHQDDHYMEIEGIIPNSQLVIVPYQPQDVHDTGTWTRLLYLHPVDWIPWVGLAVVVSTILLGIIVVFLHINEKREDEAERKKALHRINFDAL